MKQRLNLGIYADLDAKLCWTLIILIHNPSFNVWIRLHSHGWAWGYEPPEQQWAAHATLGFKSIIEEMMIEWRQEQWLLFAAPSLHPPPVSTLTLVLMERAFCQPWPSPAATRLPVTGHWAPRSKVHFPLVSMFLVFSLRAALANHLRESWGGWIIIHKESLQTLAWLTLPRLQFCRLLWQTNVPRRWPGVCWWNSSSLLSRFKLCFFSLWDQEQLEMKFSVHLDCISLKIGHYQFCKKQVFLNCGECCRQGWHIIRIILNITLRRIKLEKTRLVVDRDKPRNFGLWFMVLGLLLIMFYLNMEN